MSLAPEERAVVVRLGETEFGIDVRRVREVLRVPPISRLPFPPPSILDYRPRSSLLGGDRTAAGELIRAHQQSVYAYLLRMSGRTDVAEDIVQECLLNKFGVDDTGLDKGIQWHQQVTTRPFR